MSPAAASAAARMRAFSACGRECCCKGCLRPGDGLCLPVSAGTLAALRYICQADPRRAFGFQASDAVLRQLSGLAETYLTVQLEHSFSTLDFYHSICWNRSKDLVKNSF